MGTVTIFLHRSVHDYCDAISVLLEASRSEIIEDMIRYIRDNELEYDVWEDYEKALEEAEAEAEEEEESGEEEESEEEEEEEKSESED